MTQIVSMIARLTQESMTKIVDYQGIFAAANIDYHPAVECNMRQHFGTFPYFAANDIYHLFNLKTDMPGHIFAKTDMVILNVDKKQHVFLSVIGIYKSLLMSSDLSHETKLNFLLETIDATIDHAWFSCRPVTKMSKCPTLIGQPTKYSFQDRLKMPAKLSNIGTYLLGINMKSSVISLMPKLAKTTQVQANKGCVQREPSIKSMTIGPNSSTISFTSNGRVVNMTKKFRPIITEHMLSVDSIMALLTVISPEQFLWAFFSDTKQIPILDFNPKPTGRTGFINYLGPNKMTVSDKDMSTDFNVIHSCFVSDTNVAQELLKMNWSFDDIVSHIGTI